VNATDFAAAQNPTEWDLLLGRGSGVPSHKDLTRDSLFVKFDPLVQKRDPLPLPKQIEADENDSVSMPPDFAAVQNPTEWDLLLGRGFGVPSHKDLTRDSLFVKFDPLVQKREALLPPPNQIDSITELNESGRNSDSSDSGDKSGDATMIEANGKLIDTDPVSPIEPVGKTYSPSPEPEIYQELTFDEEVDPENELKSLEELLAESEKENEEIKMETMLAKQDLSEMESCFAEVLLNYESGKLYQKNFELNQKILETRISQLESCLVRREEKHQYIEMKTLEMTEEMKKEQEARLKSLSSENYKLKASLKMSEFKIQNVENEIDHITTSNTNLQKMCDEMIQQC